MFTGCYEHSLDDKNRLRIPAKFKSSFHDRAPVVTKGADGCLYIYTEEAVENMTKRIVENPPKTKAELNAIRKFVSSMYQLSEDGQGRFTLSPQLREYASVKKDIVFVGVVDHIELWSKERYEESMNSVDEELYDSTVLGFFGAGLKD